MTAEQLRAVFNIKFTNPLHKWPQQYEVDPETYANVCQYMFDNKHRSSPLTIEVSVGPHNGLMFKGVELILVQQDVDTTTENRSGDKEGK